LCGVCAVGGRSLDCARDDTKLRQIHRPCFVHGAQRAIRPSSDVSSRAKSRDPLRLCDDRAVGGRSLDCARDDTKLRQIHRSLLRPRRAARDSPGRLCRAFREAVLRDRFSSVRGTGRREAALHFALQPRRDVRAVLVDREQRGALRVAAAVRRKEVVQCDHQHEQQRIRRELSQARSAAFASSHSRSISSSSS